MKTRTLIIALVLSLHTLPKAHAQGGSLTPPGPPGPTMKTLDEVEPRTPLNQSTTPGDSGTVFKITQPGSYVLTSNLAPPNGKHGVVIVLASSGRVELDLMGYTINGQGAGGSASGIMINAGAGNDSLCSYMIKNGTLRSFNGPNIKVHADCLGDTATHEVGHWAGLNAVDTSGRLTMTGGRIQDPTGAAVIMGAESSLSGVEIRDGNAGGTPLIVATGTRHSMVDVLVSSVSSGSGNPAAILVGADSKIIGLSARFSGGAYSGTVLGTTSGFAEVTGLDIVFTGVTAVSGVSSLLTSVQYPYEFAGRGNGLFTSVQWPYEIKAVNSTFSGAIHVIPAGFSTDSSNHCPRISLVGTTTAAAALSLASDNYCPLIADINIAPTAGLTGAAIQVSGSGNTIRANIRGIPGNGTGIQFTSGTGNVVEGSVFIGRGDNAITAVRLNSGVTNTLVSNNRGSRWAGGSVMVDNLGGNTNAEAPVFNSSTLGTNSNPLGNYVQ